MTDHVPSWALDMWGRWRRVPDPDDERRATREDDGAIVCGRVLPGVSEAAAGPGHSSFPHPPPDGPKFGQNEPDRGES